MTNTLGNLHLLLTFAAFTVDTVSGTTADFVRAPNATIANIAFGSCHNARKVQPNQPNIWTAVQNEKPDVFVWTGDAVYPPQRKAASVNLLHSLFDDMHTNDTIGYNQLKPKHGIYGTWDDHDFGGNDMGREMPNKMERAVAFYDFLRLPAISNRQGLYYTVSFGDAPDRQVKLIFLDTRWHRGRYCFPSIADRVPLGAGLSAAMRWMLAGFNINQWWPFWECMTTSVLGEEQWRWLESELEQSQAAVHVVVSSIQVLTTNPTVEGWGHFPSERQRLIRLLGQGVSGLFVLSGDVHHAEIMDPLASLKTATGDKNNNKQSFLEVTSSGLTHDCSQPFYGKMCQPLLDHYNRNRFDSKDNYYIGRNYGQIAIDWEQKSAEIVVKNEVGQTVLRTGPRPFHQDTLTAEEVDRVAACVDGHMIQPVARVAAALAVVVLVQIMPFPFLSSMLILLQQPLVVQGFVAIGTPANDQHWRQQHHHHQERPSGSIYSATTASDNNNNSSNQKASAFFQSLLERFQGDFDNYPQVVRDRDELLLPREGGGHEQIHCLLLPVVAVASSSNNNKNKAGRLAAFYFDGIPQRIFRFRYYELTCSEGEKTCVEDDSDKELSTVVDMKLYCLNPALEGQLRGMEDPLDWPVAVETFAAAASKKNQEDDVVTLLEKCDIQWSCDMDLVQHAYAIERNLELETQQHTNIQPDLGIHAVMTYGEATVESTMIPGTKIRIMDQLSLWEDQFWIHDRGFYPETGAFIYGNQRGVPYQLERVANIVASRDDDNNDSIDDGHLKRQVVNPSLQWTLGPNWRTEEEYQAKLDAVGGGVSSQLNQRKK